MRQLPTMADRARTLGDFLRVNQHAYTRAELLARWPRSALDRSLDQGGVVRLLPGVYCGRDHTRNPVVMGDAVNLWVPDGLVTGALALHLYSPALPVPTTVDVLVVYGRHIEAPAWVHVHQTKPPRSSGAARGVRCVMPERALLEAWRFAARSSRRPLLYEALWARACTWRQLARELQRTPRIPARRELERTLAWFSKGATSPLEVRARREVFIGPRFLEFEWQVELRVGNRMALADMLHRAAMLVVELDGERYHSTLAAVANDRQRDIDLAAAGFLTVRFGWADVTQRPHWCRERLLAIVAARLPRATAGGACPPRRAPHE